MLLNIDVCIERKNLHFTKCLRLQSTNMAILYHSYSHNSIIAHSYEKRLIDTHTETVCMHHIED